jgi:hypothetical protein
MGFKDWRAKHSMRDPVRGQFQVTGSYDAHPSGSGFQSMLTGVVTGPGIPPTAGEHLDDHSGRRFHGDELPVIVDRSDPARFVIVWDEVAAKPDHRAVAGQQAARVADAQRAAQLRAGVIAEQARRLWKIGEPATAVLTGVTELPVAQFPAPGPTGSYCDLSLEVTRSDGRTYNARTRVGFRSAERRAAVTAPGVVLAVRIDPADQARVVIDIDPFSARHPGS